MERSAAAAARHAKCFMMTPFLLWRGAQACTSRAAFLDPILKDVAALSSSFRRSSRDALAICPSGTRDSSQFGQSRTKAGVICHHAAMTKVLVYVPIVLSLVILGAHFMRYGSAVGVFGSAALIALLIVRRAWVARLMQVALTLGALEWIRTLYELVQVRAALGQPFTRMIIILGFVAAITLCSALLFQSSTLKKIYRSRVR